MRSAKDPKTLYFQLVDNLAFSAQNLPLGIFGLDSAKVWKPSYFLILEVSKARLRCADVQSNHRWPLEKENGKRS